MLAPTLRVVLLLREKRPLGEDRLFSNRDHLKVFGVVVGCAIGITVMLRLQLLEVAAQSVLPSVVERAERPVCGAVVGRGAGDGRGDGRGGSADGVTCHAASDAANHRDKTGGTSRPEVGGRGPRCGDGEGEEEGFTGRAAAVGYDYGYDGEVFYLGLALDERYVEGWAEGCLERIRVYDPDDERLFQDLWEYESQREVVIESLKADCEIRPGRS